MKVGYVYKSSTTEFYSIDIDRDGLVYIASELKKSALTNLETGFIDAAHKDVEGLVKINDVLKENKDE